MLEVCLLKTKAFVEKRTEFSLKALEEQERQEQQQAVQVAGSTGGRMPRGLNFTNSNSPNLQSLANSNINDTRVGGGDH